MFGDHRRGSGGQQRPLNLLTHTHIHAHAQIVGSERRRAHHVARYVPDPALLQVRHRPFYFFRRSLIIACITYWPVLASANWYCVKNINKS